MNAPLRPMNLGEILDRTFQIYRSNLLRFAGMAALPAVAMLGFRLADAAWLHSQTRVHTSDQGNATLWGFVVWLGFYHLSCLLAIPIQPAYIRSASKAILGEAGSLRGSLRFAAARWRSYLWIGVLKLCAGLLGPEVLVVGLIFFAAFLSQHFALFSGDSAFPVVLVFSLLAIGVFLFVWLSACFSLAVPVGALESGAGFKTLRRSWSLTRASRGRIAVSWAMFAVFGWAFALAIGLLFRSIVAFAWQGHHFDGLAQRLYLEVTFGLYAVISTFVAPLYPITITLFYYDQRIRHEGYDIERMMEIAGLNTAASLSVEAQPVVQVGVEEGQA